MSVPINNLEYVEFEGKVHFYFYYIFYLQIQLKYILDINIQQINHSYNKYK